MWVTNDFGLYKSDLDIVNWIKETDFGSTYDSFIDDAGNLYILGWGHDRIGLHILPALEEEWIFKELPDNHLHDTSFYVDLNGKRTKLLSILRDPDVDKPHSRL